MMLYKIDIQASLRTSSISVSRFCKAVPFFPDGVLRVPYDFGLKEPRIIGRIS